MLFKIQQTNSSLDYSKKENSLLVKVFSSKKELETDVEKFLSKNKIELNAIVKKGFLKDDKNQIKFTNHFGKPDFIILAKIFSDDKFDVDKLRDYFSRLFSSLKDEKIKNIQIELPDFIPYKKYFKNSQYFYQTIIEGIHLGNYSFNKYKSNAKTLAKLAVNFSPKNKVVSKSIKDGENLIRSVSFARDLSNEPAITLTPGELVKRTRKMLTPLGIKVTAMNKAELKNRKMNSLLTVAEGSPKPPYLLVMRYKPTVKSKKKIALVGKGVTYDSGGYSIKPSDAMIEMNADMAGASTVIGTMMAAATLKLPVELVGVVPAVENMISGDAYKPGDIISTSSGKTIEVKNTDAEGRLILADALEYTSKLKPDEIIDFATLTGAVVIALGEFTGGLFTKNDDLANDLIYSGTTTFERIWRLPLWDDYNDGLKSELADTSNLGPRWGGAITAAKFLEKFVDKKIPWAHIDLAGPALKHKFRSYTEMYNTGFGVRLMVDYLSKK